jgi:hypothetical protein
MSDVLPAKVRVVTYEIVCSSCGGHAWGRLPAGDGLYLVVRALWTLRSHPLPAFLGDDPGWVCVRCEEPMAKPEEVPEEPELGEPHTCARCGLARLSNITSTEALLRWDAHGRPDGTEPVDTTWTRPRGWAYNKARTEVYCPKCTQPGDRQLLAEFQASSGSS